MSLVIAVKSCQWDLKRGAHELIRENWGRDVRDADLRFFVGGIAEPGLLKEDEINVSTADDYKSLPFKTREICRWAINNNYQNGFFCDTGSFVVPHHLMMEVSKVDYLGYWGMKMQPYHYVAQDINRGCPPVDIPKCFPYGSGGGYLLSRRAMEFVANGEPDVHAEDLWVGQVLAKNHIFLTDGAQRGFKGRTVDWISGEKNHYPDALEKRKAWFEDCYQKAKQICEFEGCDGKSWQLKNQPTRDLSDPDDVEKILAERRRARREK